MVSLPALAICGVKNSGKTTLIEAVLPRLLASGLKVVVIKEAGRQLEADRPGKDSDRFFQAGADVVCRSDAEQFLRRHRVNPSPGPDGMTAAVCRHESQASDEALLCELSEHYDLILVEGPRGVSLPKVWLASEGESSAPPEATDVLKFLPRDGDRPAALVAFLDEWLPRVWRATPVYVGVLIGGKSSRMGAAKHLLQADGRTWLERTVERLQGAAVETVLLGRGELPASLANMRRLVDVPDAAGPLAGILSALRWAPRASWLIVACDLPHLSRAAVDWLLDGRRPGVWAVLPQLSGGGHLETLLAHYDFRARPPLERLAAVGNFRAADLAKLARVATPAPPADLAGAWANVNSPGALADLGNQS